MQKDFSHTVAISVPFNYKYLSFGSKNAIQNQGLLFMATGCEVKPEGLGRPQAGGGAKRNPCSTMI